MAARRGLHLPRIPYEDAVDVKALNRAARLSAAVSAVESLDLKAIAETYQRTEGASELEAAAVAASALGIAVNSALGRAPGATDATRRAQAHVEIKAKRRVRARAGAQARLERLEEEGPNHEPFREEQRSQLAARADRALAGKEERLHGDAAARRAVREERMALAAGRRGIADARAFLRLPRTSDLHEWPTLPALPAHVLEGAPAGSPGAEYAAQDPVLQHAKSLVSGASQVLASLDQQNEELRQRAAGFKAPRPPPPARIPFGTGAAARAAVIAAEEEALLAKAKELLADYKPPEAQRKAAVPKSRQRAEKWSTAMLR